MAGGSLALGYALWVSAGRESGKPAAGALPLESDSPIVGASGNDRGPAKAGPHPLLGSLVQLPAGLFFPFVAT